MITKDGGNSWFSSDSLQSESSLGFTAVFFIDSQKGWVAGSDINTTKNSGSSWTLEFSGVAEVRDMFFVNENCGWLLTAGGQIYKYRYI